MGAATGMTEEVTVDPVTTATIGEITATTDATTVFPETGNSIFSGPEIKKRSEIWTAGTTAAETTTIDADHHETLTEMIVNGETFMIDETVRLALQGAIVDQTTAGRPRATQCRSSWNRTRAGPPFSLETRSSRRSFSPGSPVESTSTNTTISQVTFALMSLSSPVKLKLLAKMCPHALTTSFLLSLDLSLRKTLSWLTTLCLRLSKR